MKNYPKTEEWALSLIGHQPDLNVGITWKEIGITYLKGFTHWFVPSDHMYERGREVEEAVFRETGDANDAWFTAEPYYSMAEFHRNADAAYRRAGRVRERVGINEFNYEFCLRRAAKLGSEQAIRDYYDQYEEIRIKYITRNAWREKKRQEKLYFRCCSLLAEEGDLGALRSLGFCYLNATGVKKSIGKGIEIIEQFIQLADIDDEYHARLAEWMDEYREEAQRKEDSTRKFVLRTIRNLFCPRLKQ